MTRRARILLTLCATGVLLFTGAHVAYADHVVTWGIDDPAGPKTIETDDPVTFEVEATFDGEPLGGFAQVGVVTDATGIVVASTEYTTDADGRAQFTVEPGVGEPPLTVTICDDDGCEYGSATISRPAAAPPPTTIAETTTMPAPASTVAPTTVPPTTEPAVVIPPPPATSVFQGGDPAPTGGGNSLPWWILAGGGLAILLGGAGLFFAPTGSTRGLQCYDFKVVWTTKTDEDLNTLKTTTLKRVKKGCVHAATYYVTVATQFRKIEPDSIVSEGGQGVVMVTPDNVLPKIGILFQTSYSRLAAAGGDGTRTRAQAVATMAMKGEPNTPAAGFGTPKHTSAPIQSTEAKFELIEETWIKVEIIGETDRWKALLKASHELSGRAQTALFLQGQTSLVGSNGALFEIQPAAFASVSSADLKALNYTVKENPKLTKSVKGKVTRLKPAVEKAEVAVGAFGITPFKFSVGVEPGVDSANKSIEARFEGGPAMQPALLGLVAVVKMTTEVEATAKVEPRFVSEDATTITSRAIAEVVHQVLAQARIEPKKFNSLKPTDEEMRCMPALRLSLGSQPELPAESDLSKNFDKDLKVKTPYDGGLRIEGPTHEDVVSFKLNGPEWHAKPGISPSEKGGTVTDAPVRPKRPKPEADETIKCWTAGPDRRRSAYLKHWFNR